MDNELRGRIMELEQSRPMTVREQFAASAMNALICSGAQFANYEECAQKAWAMADNMVRTRPMPKVAKVTLAREA